MVGIPVETPSANAAAFAAMRNAVGVNNSTRIGSALGDSITAQGAVGLTYSNNSYIAWTRILSMGSLDIPISNVFGVGGDTIGSMFARISSITSLSPKPDFCLVCGGANATTAATMKADMANIIKALHAANILPVIAAAMPSLSAPTATLRRRASYNTWMREVARGNPTILASYGITPGRPVIFADATRNFVDFTSSIADPITNRTQDGLHWSPTGAFYVGKEIVDVLTAAGYITPNRSRSVIPGDIYDATDNPNGNLLATDLGTMTGTGGTVQASAGMTVTGTPSNGLQLYRQVGNATSTAVLTKEAKPDATSGERLRLQYTVTVAGTNYERIQLRNIAAITVVPGDVLVAEIEYTLNSATSNAVAVSINLRDTAYDSYQTQTSNPGNYPAVAHSGTLRTPAYTVPGGTTNAWVFFEIWLDGRSASESVDVSIDRMSLRKLN